MRSAFCAANHLLKFMSTNGAAAFLMREVHDDHDGETMRNDINIYILIILIIADHR